MDFVPTFASIFWFFLILGVNLASMQQDNVHQKLLKKEKPQRVEFYHEQV